MSPNRHGPALRSYLVPFITKAVAESVDLAENLLGRVADLREGLEGNSGFRARNKSRADIGHVANVIDSRTLVSYPYRHMEPDKEHFIGEDMDLWADKVFDMVERDLSPQPFAALKPLSEKAPARGAVSSREQPTPPPAGRKTEGQDAQGKSETDFQDRANPGERIAALPGISRRLRLRD